MGVERLPAPSARPAATIIALEPSRIIVLAPVTPMGSRGWSGGGHAGALTRSTQNDATSPAKSMVSPPMRKSVASNALSITGRRGGGARPWAGPPPGGGERGRSTAGAVAAAGHARWFGGGHRAAPRRWALPSKPHEQSSQRQGSHDAEQDASEASVLLGERVPTHALSSASRASTAGR